MDAQSVCLIFWLLSEHHDVCVVPVFISASVLWSDVSL